MSEKSPWARSDLPARREEEIIQREHSAEMTMDEFVGWLNQNFVGSFSVKDALQQAAFMLCCDVIAQDIGKAKLRLYEETSPKTARIVKPSEHKIAEFLALEPNSRHIWQDYTEMMVYWACLTKNAYSVIKRNRSGEPIALIPIQSGRVRELISPERELFYEITAGTMQEEALLGAMYVRLPERDVVHVRSRMLDGMSGFSTLAAGATSLQTGKNLEEYRSELFGEAGQLRGVFTKEGEGVLPDEAFNRLRSQFRELMLNFRNLVEPIVLESGIKFESISSKPAEMELTKQFEAQINQTCRLLRVPPHKVFNLDGSKYENLETQEKAYVGDTLVPIASSFEARYDRGLLSRKDRTRYFLRHDREEMTIKDTKAETERAVRSLERGGITWDEYRAIIGLNELPNGQGKFRIVPVNMTILDENGDPIHAGKPDETDDSENETDDTADTGEKVLKLVP